MNDRIALRRTAALGILAGIVIVLGACGLLPAPDPARSEAMAKSAADASTAAGYEPSTTPKMRPKPLDGAAAVDAAVASTSRPVPDRLRDENRRPGEVLKFFEIRPGMKVLDLWSGGGYYTELLSRLVGSNGTVVAHNNGPYLDFTKNELATRYGDNRLSNVQPLVAENNQLSLPANSFDAVLMTNVYHDVYLDDDKIGWEPIDTSRFLAEVFQSMKPGAVLGIVDHAAAAGAPAAVGGTLHRIDPDRVRKDFTAAGFVLEAESDVLRNLADDHTRVVFDPTIQGRTDQFVFRFRKPQ